MIASCPVRTRQPVGSVFLGQGDNSKARGPACDRADVRLVPSRLVLPERQGVRGHDVLLHAGNRNLPAGFA